ncbi:MAG: hypothetical protein PHH59_01605 [Methylovulum sp.]|uniref:hypothetical protein n=1 Tax=Methylovulum sp. TaxID=1916980 RepID=UPI00260AD4D5|nr:hypothetical protein [Methylovulum sp.]MDD2722704.1 hypothetical protein [Methylovulum sp.]MDD5125188.1 hypothetical protein [Methylovulum sp.]
MRKLFSLIAAATILMILIVGSGVYWLTSSETVKAREDSAAAEARNIALGFSAQIDLLNKTLDKMAQDPEVINAITMGNSGLLKVAAAKLEQYIPDILKIRLLLPDINAIDEQSKPPMGFADLDLVRETLTHNQFPSIQGEKGVDRHFALARGVIQNGKVVGVILASFNENVILKNLHLATIKNAYLELKQGQLVLATLGKRSGLADIEAKRFNIPNTDWTINYQSSDAVGLANLSMIFCIVVVPSLIILLVLFVGQRWLSNIVRQDLESLMKAFKDIMTHTSHSNYPVELTEFTAAISNLMQFKRVLDYGDRETTDVIDHEANIIVSDDDDFDLDGLFDEISDYKL